MPSLNRENERLPRALEQSRQCRTNDDVDKIKRTPHSHRFVRCRGLLARRKRAMSVCVCGAPSQISQNCNIYQDIKNKMYVAQHYFSAQFTSATTTCTHSLYKYNGAQDKRTHWAVHSNERKKPLHGTLRGVVGDDRGKSLSKVQICERRASTVLQTALNGLRREWILYTLWHSHPH